MRPSEFAELYFKEQLPNTIKSDIDRIYNIYKKDPVNFQFHFIQPKDAIGSDVFWKLPIIFLHYDTPSLNGFVIEKARKAKMI